MSEEVEGIISANLVITLLNLERHRWALTGLLQLVYGGSKSPFAQVNIGAAHTSSILFSVCQLRYWICVVLGLQQEQ